MARILLLSEDYQNAQKVSFRRVGAIVRYLSQHGDAITVASAIAGPAKGEWGEDILCLKASSTAGGNRGTRRKTGWLQQGMVDRSTLFWITKVVKSRSLREAAKNSDVIVATYGPAGPLWAAYLLAIVTRRPFVVDFRDVPQSRTRDNSLAMLADRLLEGLVINRASLVITVGRVLAEYLGKRHHGARCEVTYNGWSDGDVDEVEAETPDNYLYYAGTVYEHRIPAFELVCRSLATTGLRLKVRLLGDNSDTLRQVALRCGVDDRVEILEGADHHTVRREQRRARAVLVLESLGSTKEWQAGTVTGKLLGLIASRRPGIAICRNGSEMSRIVSQFSWWGVASDSEALSGLLNAPALEVEPGAGEASLEPFKMEQQIKRLREKLVDIVAKRAPEPKS